jgi:hypothetical protein
LKKGKKRKEKREKTSLNKNKKRLEDLDSKSKGKRKKDKIKGSLPKAPKIGIYLSDFFAFLFQDLLSWQRERLREVKNAGQRYKETYTLNQYTISVS